MLVSSRARPRRASLPIGVGAIVDESIELYRRAWQPFVAVAVLWTVLWLLEEAWDHGGAVGRAMADQSAWLAGADTPIDGWFWLRLVGDALRDTVQSAALGVIAIGAGRGDLLCGGQAVRRALGEGLALVRDVTP